MLWVTLAVGGKLSTSIPPRARTTYYFTKKEIQSQVPKE